MGIDKEALKYLVELEETTLIKVDGKDYSTKRLCEVLEPVAESFQVHTLTGLMNYINENIDQLRCSEKIIVQIGSPTGVRIMSELYGKFKQREIYVECVAILPKIRFDSFLDSEQFIIMMQALFVESDDRTAVLKLAGNVREENVKTTGDDGISQQVTAKIGIAMLEDVTVPNPVILRPYRTFLEVDQPSSPFVFRMKDGPQFALFEADGGMWRNQAIENIRDYIEGHLDKELAEFVSIIA
jgi:hypothetical protein